jgi:hypothetical protein
MHRTFRDRPEGWHHQPEPVGQHSGSRSAGLGRPDGHLHPLPPAAGRADEAHRRLRRIRKPIIGLRTATHAFNPKSGTTYANWSANSKEWDGGFGRQVLGETWISHHGKHGKQSTRGIIAKGQDGHPILRGIKYGGIWGPTDVYGVRLPLPGDSTPLVLGEIVDGMRPTDPPVIDLKMPPLMPIAWTHSYKTPNGKSARTFTSTMASSQDFESEGLRRLLVNACYWAVGLEDRIPEKTNVDLVGEYKPSPFKGDGFKKGVKPSDLAGK